VSQQAVAVELLSIGQLARACRVSVPTLRKYDELGLLPPAEVDEGTGYRWYRPDQVRAASLIRLLREVQVPLAMIRELLAEPDGGRALTRLDTHWDDVERRVAAGRRTKYYLRRLLGANQEDAMTFPIITTQVPDQPALARRRRVSIDELVSFISAAEVELDQQALDRQLHRAGPALAVFHDPVNNETDGEVEVCLPVAAHGDVLPGGTLAQTDARGADTHYPRILAAYDAVAAWAHQQHRPLLGPPREIYVAADHFVIGWLVGEADQAERQMDTR